MELKFDDKKSAKCQTHPLSGKSSFELLKIGRENARGSHSGSKLDLPEGTEGG